MNIHGIRKPSDPSQLVSNDLVLCNSSAAARHSRCPASHRAENVWVIVKIGETYTKKVATVKDSLSDQICLPRHAFLRQRDEDRLDSRREVLLVLDHA